jgi:hypothetical protein
MNPMTLTASAETVAVKSPATPETIERTNRAASNDRWLFKIVSYSTASALGAVVASDQALIKDASGFSFHLSMGTPAAFAVGVLAGLIYWKIVFAGSTGGRVLLLRISSFLLLLGGVGAFLYPLRFLPTEKLPEVFVGLSTAAVALSLVAFVLWRFKKFFEQETA